MGAVMAIVKTYSFEDLLKPLAITVIIDTKVRPTEIQEFTKQASGLLDLLCQENNHTNDTISNWFKTHKKAITEHINSNKRNTFILKTLSIFKDDDIAVEALYDAMLHISISDKKYHVQESDLIKSAAALWGYERPPFKITER